MSEHRELAGQRSTEERQALLGGEIQHMVRQGYRVESQVENQAVLVKGRRPNHLLHLVLTIITFSFWGLFVWLPLVMFGGEKRRVVTVDPFGSVLVAKGRG